VNLHGKVAIVTGGARGIGRCVALELAATGASVAVTSLTPARVQAVADEIAAAGGSSMGVPCDVSIRAEVDQMVGEVVERFGRVDILVNCAQGFGSREQRTESPHFRPLEAFPEDEWDYTFATGLKGTLYAMQAVFPSMKDRGGRIINFASGNGIGGMKGTAAYNATKEAIRALTRTAAAEWGRYGITVNVIVPTMVTESARDFMASRPGVEEKLIAQIPMRRMGDVEKDIGPVIAFLASEGAGFVTGQTVSVDGGQTLRP
jgi:2-hydroxycyclohexanecarboxyl-CoA dehydrogenase